MYWFSPDAMFGSTFTSSSSPSSDFWIDNDPVWVLRDTASAKNKDPDEILLIGLSKSDKLKTPSIANVLNKFDL